MVTNLEQKKIHLDLRFILTYNMYMKMMLQDSITEQFLLCFDHTY